MSNIKSFQRLLVVQALYELSINENRSQKEKLDPNKFKALHKMGQCYQKLDDHSLAVVQFEKSIDVIESLNENYEQIIQNYELMDLITYCDDAIGVENVSVIKGIMNAN